MHEYELDRALTEFVFVHFFGNIKLHRPDHAVEQVKYAQKERRVEQELGVAVQGAQVESNEI